MRIANRGSAAGLLLLAACGTDRIAGPKLADTPRVTAAVAAGADFTCALTADGKPFCWGGNGAGQLGDSAFAPTATPLAVLTNQTFVAIYAAELTVCALDHSGAAWCWGDDPSQPGVPESFLYTPQRVHAPQAFGSLTVGRKFACGLDAGGSAWCWGENGHGQLGAGDTATHASPTRVVGGVHFASLQAGFFSTCGLTAAGAAYCWGDNFFGELGTGDTLSAFLPRRVGGDHVFTSLSGGATHQCGVAADGSAFCWGTSASGQLGDGTGATRLVPTAVAGGLKFTLLRSARANSIFASTCGVTTGGDVYCWGWNSKGQLGVDPALTTDPCTSLRPPGTNNVPGVVTNVCSFHPLKVAGVSGVVGIEAGQAHNCALTAGAQLLCWGQNSGGELGDGTAEDHTTPVSPLGGLLFP